MSRESWEWLIGLGVCAICVMAVIPHYTRKPMTDDVLVAGVDSVCTPGGGGQIDAENIWGCGYTSNRIICGDVLKRLQSRPDPGFRPFRIAKGTHAARVPGCSSHGCDSEKYDDARMIWSVRILDGSHQGEICWTLGRVFDPAKTADR